jgi:hypothetical protein
MKFKKIKKILRFSKYLLAIGLVSALAWFWVLLSATPVH